MKTLKKSYIIPCIIALLVCGCEEAGPVSKITHFADFDFGGEETMFVETGTPYVEPGVTASESGTDVEVETSISGTYFGGATSSINTNSSDEYRLTYSAVNSDGFPGSVSRTVFVVGKGDLVTDISGLYTSTVSLNGTTADKYTNMEYVIINKTGDDTYRLSDIAGGYYDLGRSYGTQYSGPSATLTANDISGNDFTFGSGAPVGVFGGSAVITEMQVTTGTKKIHFVTEWDDDDDADTDPYVFDVTLTQVAF